jgi:hypothetical protein
MYKVKLYFNTAKDDWENGETGEYGASWTDSRECQTLEEVKEFVKDNTYSGYEYIEFDEFNDFYITAYTTTDENDGEMDKTEKDAWKKGEINGWTVSVDIIVEEYKPKRLNNLEFKEVIA